MRDDTLTVAAVLGRDSDVGGGGQFHGISSSQPGWPVALDTLHDVGHVRFGIYTVGLAGFDDARDGGFAARSTGEGAAASGGRGQSILRRGTASPIRSRRRHSFIAAVRPGDNTGQDRD